eukprot:5935029-Amphidinium_carterae.3
MTLSLREASRLCPEFERMHVDTPRKLQPSEYAVAVKRLGRPTLFGPSTSLASQRQWQSSAIDWW